MNVVWVALGGACGSLVRFVISRWMTMKWKGPLPIGTLFVNVTGSFLLGVVVSFAVTISDDVMLFSAVGGLGAYTTFSTFSIEAVQLWQQSSRRYAVLYVTASVLFGLAAVALGLWIGNGFIPS